MYYIQYGIALLEHDGVFGRKLVSIFFPIIPINCQMPADLAVTSLLGGLVPQIAGILPFSLTPASNVVPFWVVSCNPLPRNDGRPKKEGHRSLWVNPCKPSTLR